MSETLAPQAVVAGRYRVVREIGQGGMGTVYLVEHVHTGERLALKALRSGAAALGPAAERFKREARASARIRSEHVVRVIDADVIGDMRFLVMELLEGYALADLSRARGKLPYPEAIAILAQVAVALDRAHSMGIVHRDVKPENVFVHRRDDGSAIVKVLDFGVAKVLAPGDAGDAAHLSTTTGVVMGTPAYMAPEQARGLPDAIGPATDVWAIGLVALRLLTGEAYWQATTMGDLMAHIIALPLDVPSQRWPWLPPGFDGWFFRSCDRDPARRFASVGEQVRELASVLGVGEVPAVTIDDGLVTARSVPSPESVTEVEVTRRAPSSRPPDTVKDATTGGKASWGKSAATQRPTGRTAITLGAAVVVLGVSAAAAVLLLGGRGTGSTAPAHGPATSIAVPWPEPPPPDSAAATASTAPAVATSSPAQAPPTTGASPGPRPVASPSRPAGSAASTTPSAAPSAKTGCTPPFFFDSAGHKQYKPECM
jgi:serine/threonine-protein kinase